MYSQVSLKFGGFVLGIVHPRVRVLKGFLIHGKIGVARCSDQFLMIKFVLQSLNLSKALPDALVLGFVFLAFGFQQVFGAAELSKEA